MIAEQPAPAAATAAPPIRLAAATGYLAFFSLGLVGTIIGALVTALAAGWSITLAEANVLLPVQSVGFLVGVLSADLVVRRLGRRALLSGELAILALGALLLFLSPGLWLGLPAMFLIGIGFGGPNVGTSMFIADLYPRHRAAALNLLNVFFGLGALGAPALVSAITTISGQGRSAVLLITLCAALSSVGFLFLAGAAPPPPTSVRPAGLAPAPHLLTDRVVQLVLLLIFFYVAVETAFSGWMPTAAILGAGLSAAVAPLLLTTYWIAVSTCRSVVAWRGKGWAATAILRWSTSVGPAGAALLAVGMAVGQPAVLALGAVVMGAGFAPIFPTAMALVTEVRHEAATAAAGLMTAAAALATFAGPPLVGLVLTGPGAVPAMLVLFAGAVLLPGVFALLHRATLTRAA